MVELIHYFIRNPIGEKGGLVYPSEINIKLYQTIGSFYIISYDDKKLFNEYIIHAIKNGQIIKVPLKRIRRNSFSAVVDGIDSFIFYAENVSMNKYSGNNPFLEGVKILKRLRIANANKAEDACKKHKFYFIGYSEIIDIF